MIMIFKDLYSFVVVKKSDFSYLEIVYDSNADATLDFPGVITLPLLLDAFAAALPDDPPSDEYLEELRAIAL